MQTLCGLGHNTAWENCVRVSSVQYILWLFLSFLPDNRAMSWTYRRNCGQRWSSSRTRLLRCARSTRCCASNLSRIWLPMNKLVRVCAFPLYLCGQLYILWMGYKCLAFLRYTECRDFNFTWIFWCIQPWWAFPNSTLPPVPCELLPCHGHGGECKSIVPDLISGAWVVDQTPPSINGNFRWLCQKKQRPFPWTLVHSLSIRFQASVMPPF